MKKIIIENTIKNIIITLILIFLYQPMFDLFSNIDQTHYPNLLTTFTLLIMAVLFADYAFTYKDTNLQNHKLRIISYAITFIIMLCTGILLELVVILVNLELGFHLYIISIVSILFYISLVLYDYWDLLRN